MEDEYSSSEEIISQETDQQAQMEDQQDFMDYQQDFSEDQQFGNYPGGKVRDSIFTFFNKILDLKDSSKVGNLDKFELGKAQMSVRACEHLRDLGKLLHNKAYCEYFGGEAEIVLATSMSKKFALAELVVSQKKWTTRQVATPVASNTPKKSFMGLGGNKGGDAQ